jgi:hypothetical protein
MNYRKIAGWLSVAALTSLSGCCSWCDRCCSRPTAYAPPPQYAQPCCPQPVCCPTGPQTAAPPNYQPNWSSPQPAYYLQTDCCQ